MHRGVWSVLLSLFVVCSVAFGQTDRGTITGTVVDPAGAVVPAAPVTARNVQTGAVSAVQTSATGNYTIAQLPVGTYEISISVPGFKQYIRQNLEVRVAQIMRIDVALEVGQATESVTVTTEAPLLTTETGELAMNVETDRLNNLPVFSIGAAGSGSQGIRNPMVAATLTPGVYLEANLRTQVNGAPLNSMTIRMEGQDATNGVVTFAQAETQPSVDAIEEVAIQISNYSAEFGQAGGGVFNYTMKSGSNAFHGSAFEYYVNDAFNAGQAYLNVKPRQRRHDFGGTIGGPVWIPGVYDGHDKTFFFFTYERFREGFDIDNTANTVPTEEYRRGDFSYLLGLSNRAVQVGGRDFVDPLGNRVLEGQLFDPLSEQIVNGQRVRTAFPGNQIPIAAMDPVALKVQSYIPAPTGPGQISNGIYPFNSTRNSPIPAIKIDHYFNEAHKASFYWSSSETAVQYCQPLCGSEGFPDIISNTRGTFIEGWTTRLNYDWTISPTILLHLGAGFASNDFKDTAPITDFDPLAELGLRGATLNRQVPRFTGPENVPPNNDITGAQSTGGVEQMGPNGQSRTRQAKPTFVSALTWVKNNHTFKFGGELRLEGYPAAVYTSTAGQFRFADEQTQNSALQGIGLGGVLVGHPYASFLLGRPAEVDIAAPANSRGGFQIWGLYAQDSWKVTRRLTLDYGLRWDYFMYPREQYGRFPSFRADIANPGADGLLGAAAFEATGPALAHNYPHAWGPRIGVAYQITPKTVLRTGFGITYFGTNAGSQGGAGATQTLDSPNFADPAMVLGTGIPVTPTWPRLIPDLFNPNKTIAGDNVLDVMDQNRGRPARQFQWSIGLQREITPNLVVDVSYVANRGVWWPANGLVDYNALRPEILMNQYGLDITNPADQTILTANIGDPAAGRFQNQLPYPSFPLNASVAQSLRPFPQFRHMNALGAPLGKTWYDALQAKVTKRLSFGLDFTWSFTWQKELTLGAGQDSGGVGGFSGIRINDVFNRNNNKAILPYSRPFVSVFAFSYRLPSFGTTGFVSHLVKDWTINGSLQWASGLPFQVPNSFGNLNSLLFRQTYAERVPGEPLFLQDLNEDFDPTVTPVLNPKAWREPGGSTRSGMFAASSPFFSDYRQRRIPSESMSIGRIFQITEGTSFQIRAEWTNIFNRLLLPMPTGSALNNPGSTVRTDSTGRLLGGFGFINTLAAPPNPGVRQGTLVMRFRF